MTATTMPAPAATTPVWRLAGQAYGLFFKNLPAIIRLIWVWLLVVGLLLGLLNYLLYPALVHAWNKPNVPSEIAFVLTSIITSLAAASIGVSWQRFILLKAPLDEAAYLRLDPLTQTSYAASLLLNAMLILPMLSLTRLITAPVPAPLWMVGLTILSIVMAVWIMIRLAPLFPAIACDADDASFGEIWLKTDGLALPLTLGFALCIALPLAVAVGYVQLQSGGLTAPPPRDPLTLAVMNAGHEVLWLFFGLIPQAFAALAYARINQR